MLSYQHAYHAGCLADVFKHLSLTYLIEAMTQKPKPLLYVDTHAGRGRYDLHGSEALKTGEAARGIGYLWSHRQALGPVFEPYFSLLDRLNPLKAQSPRYYPGSPWIAQQLLRTHDRMVFCERHPQEWTYLERLPHEGKRVHCKHEDGPTTLKALLPPPERRALIFIDPSYELKTEYRELPQVLEQSHRRFSTGVYCLWYPLIHSNYHTTLLKGLQRIQAEKWLHAEWYLHNDQKQGMLGSGLWIINPPFGLDKRLTDALLALTQALPKHTSSHLLRTNT